LGLRDKIGVGITNFLYPYLQNQTRFRGGKMPRTILDYENYKLQEKYLWFLGSEDLLVDFYQTQTSNISVIDTKQSYYYANVNSNIRIIHSGFPSLISFSKSTLLMSGGIEQVVVDGVGENKKESVKDTELLNEILEDNEMDKLNKSAVTTESWGGKFAYKISKDIDISEFPITEKYLPLNYETIKKRGRLQEIIFKTPFELEDDSFELQEHYGFGYITNELFKLVEGEMAEVPLTTLEETKDLQDIQFDKSIMLAAEKEIEKSDYRGLFAEFDALDETWSQLMDEIRKGRSKTYIPEILADNKTFDEFNTNYVITGTDDREGGKNEIKQNQPDIRVKQYTESIVAIRSNILAVVKLNPLTVGINDNIGANASSEALEQRETTSLRTRKDMIPEWELFLERFYNTLLNAVNIFESLKAGAIEFDVQVKIGEYVTPTIEAVIKNAKDMKDSDIIDAEKALDEIFGKDLDQEEKDRILQNVDRTTIGAGAIDFLGTNNE